MICDFCFLPDGEYRHIARDADNGWWVACPGCQALIDAGARYELATRGVTNLRALIGDPGYSADAIRALHDNFWTYRDQNTRPYRVLKEAVAA